MTSHHRILPSWIAPRAQRRAPLLTLIIVIASLASYASAQTTQPATIFDGRAISRDRPANGATPPSAVDWHRLLLAMVVVVGLILALRYAAVWLFPSTRARGGGRGVRVLGRTAIAPRQQVMLLQVGRRILVVGDSAGALSALANIDGPDEVAEILGQVSSGDTTPVAGRFRSIFGSANRQFEPTAADAESHAAGEAEEGGPVDANVVAAQDEISGLLDRMRSLTRAARR